MGKFLFALNMKIIHVLFAENAYKDGGENVDLSKVKTSDLVRELEKREGVEVTVAEPYEDVTVSVNGPAIVLVVTD